MKLLSGRKGVVLAAILTTTIVGCTTYVERTVYRDQPPPEQPAPPPPPVVVQTAAPPPPQVVVVEIRTERDFYEPLTPYGHWEVVGAYGRCWVPARVDSDWRRTATAIGNAPKTAGIGPATSLGPGPPIIMAAGISTRRIGWYWVPQTQWAPAWVSWRRGESYVGWAPLPPSARFERDELIVEERSIPPRGYVFVEERRFMEPAHPKTVIVNNTTIINKTVNITKVKVVNKTVINEGPQTTVIERASGRPVRAVPVHDLRRKTEAEVVAKQKPAIDHKPEREAQQRQELEKRNQLDAQKAAREKQAQAEAQRREQEAQRKAQMENERAARLLNSRDRPRRKSKSKLRRRKRPRKDRQT